MSQAKRRVQTIDESTTEKSSGKSSGQVQSGLPSQDSTSKIIPCAIIADVNLKYPIISCDTHTIQSPSISFRQIADQHVTCAMRVNIPVNSNVPSVGELLQNPLVKSAFTVFQKMLVRGFETELVRLNPKETKPKTDTTKDCTESSTQEKQSSTEDGKSSKSEHPCYSGCRGYEITPTNDELDWCKIKARYLSPKYLHWMASHGCTKRKV
jgi:hypothetical protein